MGKITKVDYVLPDHVVKAVKLHNDYSSLTLDDKKRLCQYICQELAGGRLLTEITREPGMPRASTIAYWATQPSECPVEVWFSEQYRRARKIQAELWFEKILTLADSVTVKDAFAVKIQIEAIKWAVQRLNPQKYLTPETASEGGSGVNVNIINYATSGQAVQVQLKPPEAPALPPPQNDEKF